MMRVSHERVPIWLSLLVCAAGCAGMFLAALSTWPGPALVLQMLQQRSLRPWLATPPAAPVPWHSAIYGSATVTSIATVLAVLAVVCTQLIARLPARPQVSLLHRAPQRNEIIGR